jgi:hypothetical protein
MGETLQSLEAAVKRRKDFGNVPCWTLLVITPAFFPLPEPNASMDIFSWRGKWRKSDVELAFDECLTASPPDSDALGWWLYSLCLGFCMIDPTLCLDLFHKAPRDMSSIIEFFNEHPVAAAMASTNKNDLISCDNAITSIPGPIRGESRITGTAETLWGKGILDIDEYGDLVIHPTALAYINRRTSLERMICRGQQQVFLPLLHRVLRHLHKRLAETCGNNWYKRSEDDSWEAVKYDIGPLPKYIKIFLHFCPEEIRNAAYYWREVRHDVAHNSFLHFDKLYRAMDSLKRT